jgi:phage tail sheath protein FI
MAEYLSPGVYVEEIETGPQPIEGVSTSTAGFIGMAERGPVNVPILITNPGDYRVWFGGLLNRDDFADPADPARSHCYLPHAVQGFFTNGGQRCYVMRVLPGEATKAHRDLFNRGIAGDPETVLLRAAAQATTALSVLDGTGFAGHVVRIGSGSASEYIDVTASGADATFTTLAVPLTQNHPAATTVASSGSAAAAPANLALNAATIGGEVAIQVTGADVATHPPARIMVTGDALPIDVTSTAGPSPYTVNLGAAMAVHGLGTVIIQIPKYLKVAAAANDQQVKVVSLEPIAAGDALKIGNGATAEVVFVTAANVAANVYTCDLAGKLAHPHAIDEAVYAATATAQALTSDAAAGDSVIYLNPGVTAGTTVMLHTGTSIEQVTAAALGAFELSQPLVDAVAAGSLIESVTFGAGLGATTLTAEASGRVISLASRMPGGVAIQPGRILQIGVAPNEEYAEVQAVVGEHGAAPDPGAVVLTQPLAATHANATAVSVLPAAGTGPRAPSRVLLDADAGGDELVVSASANWVANDLLRLTATNGEVSYRRLFSNPLPSGSPGLIPSALTLGAPLIRTHGVGADVAVRESLFEVEALDAGAWGRRIRVAVGDEAPGLVPRAIATPVGPSKVKLSTLTGVEPGTYLEMTDDEGNLIDEAAPLKVRVLDRANATVEFDAPMSVAQLGALGTATPAHPILVRSREFSLRVMLYRQPDAAVPTRNEQVIQSELFRQLSLDPRHSRYIEKVIGATDGPPALEDRRPKGGSMLIRVLDRAANAAAAQQPRLGPEVMNDLMPGGLTRAARFQLDQEGDDSMATVSDAMYVGVDDNEPENRTGIPALRNVPQVSIVAVPGQASAAIQAALIEHCEAARYRFAVLDPETAEDSLADIQAQRQAFDTKYAAFYYPWVTIPDPMPANLSSVAPFPLPPSGHVAGIFARVDEQRGVHKAPANEVVLGITDVARKIYKGEQDMLNPEPSNINVIRDFRADGRSIRVWGARCITSDGDYKYVPVRRLIMFIEQSIDRGLQWAVFEPNAPALWARVSRSITNFLVTVWRSGALEGFKPEEAFFVKCGLDTMTQDDIDNGRLIVEVGVAPAKPAEFVIIRIGLTAAISNDQ